MQLGALLLVEGSLDAAEANYRKAVVLLTRHTGADDLRTAKALAGLGRLYAEWGKYEESGRLLHEARTIAEKNMPTSDSALINILDSEAALLCQSHRYAEAERCWLRALKISERDHGDGGLEYGALLLHLGQLYTAIRDYRAAQEILERGLAVEQKTKEADTMDSAIAMSALGNVYLRQHKLSQAETLFQQSLGVSNGNCEAIPLACAAVSARKKRGSMKREPGKSCRPAATRQSIAIIPSTSVHFAQVIDKDSFNGNNGYAARVIFVCRPAMVAVIFSTEPWGEPARRCRLSA